VTIVTVPGFSVFPEADSNVPAKEKLEAPFPSLPSVMI
jgi:hypothetical protein